MDKNYWIGRWERGETAWHQSEVEPALVTYFSQYFSHRKPSRVLVPLCGKSLDLVWLASQGHEVIGVELSSMACEQFFAEHSIPCQKTSENGFVVYRGKNITLFNGDFFQLQTETLGKIGAIYDRAALIALPPDLRPRYTSQILQFIQKCALQEDLFFLQIVLERTPHDTQGPPFSVPLADLEKLYGAQLKITPLSREPVDMGPNHSPTQECIYRLQTK